MSKSRAAATLAEYLERCFFAVGYSLEVAAKDQLGRLVGEVLGNVEDHVPNSEWWVVAYMRKPRTKPYGDCHITLFNFGPTMAETLMRVESRELRGAIDDLVEVHRSRNFFRQFQDRWTEECLWTLYALQEGVSRFYGEEGQHHGIGTADMIEAFQELGGTIGGEQPRMALISGHTHITFDGRYRIALKKDEAGQGRRILAFNASNSLEEPPDSGTVRRLTAGFPGTLLSLRFYMHDEFLVRRGS